ncbi:MAG TPA: hypothetical protein VHX64_12485, partial [Caulobacteraceae bacterium]|nr:hypothetical protein [Caulobacteraceae bacterium]
MTETNVEFRFGAQTSGVEAGGQQVKSVLGQLRTEVGGLGSAFKTMGESAVTGFGRAREGALTAAEGVRNAAEQVSALREMLAGIGEAMIAAFAIEQVVEWTKEMGEAAEATMHTAETFGLATTDVQRLKAEATLLGIPFEAITTAMQRSDRALTTAREGSRQAAEAFKLLGIDIHDPIGQIDLINQEMAGLATIQDVPTRIGVAMQLFGRNIQAVAPMIGVTKAKLDDYNQTIVDSGAVSADAEAKGLALADANNKFGVALQGLGNVMMTSFAPLLTQVVGILTDLVTGFVQSYNSGGLAKQMMDGLAVALKAVVGVVEVLVTGFIQLGEVIAGVVGSAVAVVRQVYDSLKLVAAYVLETIAAVVSAVVGLVQGGVGQMQANWHAAMTRMGADTSAISAQMQQDASDVETSWNNAAAAIGATGAALVANLGNLQNPTGGHFGTSQDWAGNAAGAPPDLAPPHKGRGNGQETQMSSWENQLRTAEQGLRAYTGAWEADMTGLEVAFWQHKLDAAKAGTALYGEIQKKLAASVLSENRTRITGELADDQAAIDAKKDDWAAELAALQKWVGDVATAYGAGSAAAKKALEKLTEAALKSLDAGIAAEKKATADQVADAKSAYEEQAAALRERFQAGELDSRQYYTQLEALQRQQTQAEVDAVNAQVAQEAAATRAKLALADLTTEQRKAILAKQIDDETSATQQIRRLWEGLFKDLSKDQTEQMRAFEQQWNSVVNPLVSSFTSGLTQMAQGTKTFQQVMLQLGQQIVGDFVTHVIDPMIESWLRK